MNRRNFICLSAASALVLSRPFAFAETNPSPAVRLTLRADRRGNKIAEDFTGLSYESAQLGNPHFFSGANTELAGFLRRLGSSGVLRIGGNTSEYCDWTPDPSKRANVPSDARNLESMRTGDKANPVAFGLAVGPNTGKKAPAPVNITPEAIRNLSRVPRRLWMEAHLRPEPGHRHRGGCSRRGCPGDGCGRLEADCIPTLQRTRSFLSQRNSQS